MDREKIKERHKVVRELSKQDQAILFALMECFQEAAIETMQDGEQLLKMCEGCAFKKGSEANNDPMTVLVATESVMKDEPFYCHKRFCPNGEEKLCNGWINIMNNK